MGNQIKHLGIIMDGNGRWAKNRGLRRTKGHEMGAKTVRIITSYCSEHCELETLTLYAFSTENWKRSKLEIDFLMKLLDNYLTKELQTYLENDIKFETIGDLRPFSKTLQKTITKTKELTQNNKGLTQILALNYGSRDEIVRAVNSLIERDEEITEQSLSFALDTPYQDLDLLVRTSGEIRLSNYLLWQVAYAELAFTPTLWPDFTADELEKIIKEYKIRERKFGGI